jgi:DeoR family fructose operon transcriptional repressor
MERLRSTICAALLRHLAMIGALGRTHGGALRQARTGFESEFEQRRADNQPTKIAIGEAAISLIDDGDCILLDTGTTTYELARLLGRKRDITVVTNDIMIALALEEIATAQVVLLGGTLRSRFHCTLGFENSDMFRGIVVDKAFMGTNSLSMTQGASTPDMLQANAKRAMVAAAQRVILLCDHTKFGQVSFSRFATLKEINTLVTDALPPEWVKPLRKAAVEVILADGRPVRGR